MSAYRYTDTLLSGLEVTELRGCEYAQASCGEIMMSIKLSVATYVSILSD